MNEKRSILATTATRRRVKSLLGLAVVALALGSVTNVAAGPRDPKGGLREMFGGGKPDGKPGPNDRKHSHEHGQDRGQDPGVGGASGVDGPHHGGMPQPLQKKLEELKQKEAAGTLSDGEKRELARLNQFQKRRQTREERKARLTELKQKETDGKLNDGEKQELERAQKVQARHDELEKKAKDRAESRKQRIRDAKRQALKEAPKVASDAATMGEYKKHAERIAKLERAKDLATADQNDDAVMKIGKLIAQETQRHQAWLAKQQTGAKGASQGATP